MDLWIRSQDETKLVLVHSLGIAKSYYNDTWSISTPYGDRVVESIGSYKSKKRALEVLDEIQKSLMPISEYKQEIDNLIINYKNIETAIYEMPKD